MNSNLVVPELCLIALVGPSGAGKSTFARKNFGPFESISSDYCRGLVSNDENDMDATGDAFDTLYHIAAKRLRRGLLTVIDATNVQKESRQRIVDLAREHDVLPVAIVLDLPESVCVARNLARPDRSFGARVIRNQRVQLQRSMRWLEREGFRYVHVLRTAEVIDAVTVERQPLWNNRRHDRGPFDIIGDLHGCCDELLELFAKLGYDTTETDRIVPPPGRKAVFLGDLTDRGPDSPGVLRVVRSMISRGDALCVCGNHDEKLRRALTGKKVQINHGLDLTLQQIGDDPAAKESIAEFLDALIGHYVLDGGRLVVAHAGMKQQYIGRASKRVLEFARYGETTGETDEFGLPVRHNWAAEYRGPAAVVYGHTPVPEADWLNGTINIDTGCVFGGKLTALRWPERQIVSVPAHRTYAEPARPFLAPEVAPTTAQQQSDTVLDVADVLGKRVITTRLMSNIGLRAENAAAALEVMSRFAADPRWLVYLPPTMSPTETTTEPGLLEHPREAFEYFRREGIPRVVCQQKHMGSRAVVIVCRDEAAAVKIFGITDDGAGIIYTRTGRRFFDDRATETELLGYVRSAIDRAGWWDTFSSGWFVLDCELMPWSAKAQALLADQYAAVGSASTAALADAAAVVARAHDRYTAAGHDDLVPLLQQITDRREMAGQYVDAYRQYCWPVTGVTDLKLAPFHLLASDGKVHVDRDHLWHMKTLAELAADSPVMIATNHMTVETGDEPSVGSGVRWWEELTASGGEGMVVKPLEFAVRGSRGLVQPAVKCRGREYLRIIYGPEYTAEDNLVRLRKRGLNAKRSLAIREFALGIEALERFARREPLRKVHECVFAVLAMESEPVDPRL